MATKVLHCSVITPEKPIYEGDVDMVAIPAHDGEIGILVDRAPLLCKLGAGEMRISGQGNDRNWFINGGFAQVIDNKVIVLTQEAIDRQDLSVAEANELLDEARKMQVTDDITARRRTEAEASARAQLRLATKQG
jgi:F-type H+-transporting ATPase subunit epsilon